MEKKEFLFDVKKLTDKGEFEGYAAVFDVADLGGDIIERGAFKKTIEEHDGVFPMTWYHDVRDPIGAVKVREDEHGLFIKGRLNLCVQSAKEKYALMKQGVIKALSFGFDTVKHEWDEIGKQTIRHLKEVKLYEVAPVLFPMQLEAQITDVKSLEDGSVGPTFNPFGPYASIIKTLSEMNAALKKGEKDDKKESWELVY